MTLSDYTKDGNPVVITPTRNNNRLAVEVFDYKGGIVFADTHWSDPLQSTHPFHVLEGRVEEWLDGFWRVFREDGGVSIARRLTGDPYDQDYFMVWDDWQSYEYRRPRDEARRYILDNFPSLKEVSE